MTVPPVAIVAVLEVVPATYHWWFADVTSVAVKAAVSGGTSALAVAGANADATRTERSRFESFNVPPMWTRK